MSQWVFLFEIAGLKIPEKKGFLHCKLYFTVSSFKHNREHPPPPLPSYPPYKLHIHLAGLVEVLDIDFESEERVLENIDI